MPNRSLLITGEQIRAARALARIEQSELAALSGLSLETIKRLERIRGPVDATVRTISSLVRAFADVGIAFERGADGGIGVRRPGAAPAQPQSWRTPWQSEPVRLLHRLTYWSTATPETVCGMKGAVDDIAEVARQRNPMLQVTGALLACGRHFLQALEGPKDAVLQVYGAISTDPRHMSLHLLESRAVGARQFEDFSLCCGVFDADEPVFRREPAMRDGFSPELLTPASALGLLSVVRDLQRSPPRIRRGERGECPLAEECLDRTCAEQAGRLSHCA